MGKIILIVDSRRMVRMLITNYCRVYFVASSVSGKIMPEIVQAENEEQARRFLTESIAPNLIVIGHQTLKTDEVKLIDEIQAKLWPETKIVLFGDLPLKDEAKQKGCLFVREDIGGEGEILKLAAEMGMFTA